MKKNLFIILLFTAVLLPLQKVFSQDYALAVKINTLGVTGEAVRSFGSYFNTRVGVSIFNYSLNGGGGAKDDYKYVMDIKLKSISALLDYVPFKNGLRLSAGVVYNLNQLGALLTPTKTYSDGGDLYTPEKLGTMNMAISYPKVAPYVGLGFGNPTFGSSGLGITFEIGAFYLGAPKVELNATGLIAPSAAPDQAELIKNNLSWFKWYPAISLGINYKI